MNGLKYSWGSIRRLKNPYLDSPAYLYPVNLVELDWFAVDSATYGPHTERTSYSEGVRDWKSSYEQAKDSDSGSNKAITNSYVI